MKECLLSIIIPIYKVEKYLRKCLDSILVQTEKEIELILVDDGSPDRSGEIADEYAEKYDCVFSYHKPNGGLSDARNYGISKANGEYLWFIDSDDYIVTNSLPTVISCLETKKPNVMVIQSMVESKAGIKDERQYTIAEGMYNSHEYMEQLKAHPEAVIFCAQYEIVQKSFVLDNNLYFYKGILHEDELWTPQVLMKAELIFYSCLNIYYHVMRDGSIMNSNNLEKSGRSDIVLSKQLFEIFDTSGRNDLVYLRDHAADTFMQSIWKVPGFLKTEDICRSLPIKNAFYKKTKLKACLYFVSPHLYLKLHNMFKS